MIVNKNFLNKSLLVLITLALCFVDIDNCAYEIICIVTILNVLFCLYIIKKQGCITLSNPLFWFWIITVAFSLGQNLAYLFITDEDAVKGNLLYGYRYTASELCSGSIFTLQALNMFTLGLFSGSKNYESITEENKTINRDYEVGENAYALGAYYFGTALLVITFLPQLIYIYAEMKEYLTLGYGQTAVEQLSGIVLRLHYLFIPSLLMSYCGSHYLGKSKKIQTLIILAQIGVFLLMGDRGTGLGLLVTFIWLRAATDQNFEVKKYILPILFVILAIPVVKYYRISYTANETSPLMGAINYVVNNNPVIDILLETGASQNILIMTMKKTASTGLAHGKAYFDFFIKMIPGFFGIEQNYGTLAKWVIGTTGYQTQGFSIWAEAYLNFGYLGIPFMFVIGYMFKYLLDMKSSSKVMSMIRISISLSFFCDIARRSISEYGYNFMYDIIVPLVIVYVIANYIKKKSVRENG